MVFANLCKRREPNCTMNVFTSATCCTAKIESCEGTRKKKVLHWLFSFLESRHHIYWSDLLDIEPLKNNRWKLFHKADTNRTMHLCKKKKNVIKNSAAPFYFLPHHLLWVHSRQQTPCSHSSIPEIVSLVDLPLMIIMWKLKVGSPFPYSSLALIAWLLFVKEKKIKEKIAAGKMMNLLCVQDWKPWSGFAADY